MATIYPMPTPERDETFAYEDAIIGRLYPPRRDLAADAAARERRRARIVQLQKRRAEAAGQELDIVRRRLEAEQCDLRRAEIVYKDTLMSSTSQAVKTKNEIGVLRERVAQLEGSLAANRQEIAGIDAERNEIATKEKQAAEDEKVAALLAESGARAAAIIDSFVAGLNELRGIVIKLHYESPRECNAANGERLRDMADMIVKSFRIKVFKRTFKYDLAERSTFLQFLRKAQ